MMNVKRLVRVCGLRAWCAQYVCACASVCLFACVLSMPLCSCVRLYSLLRIDNVHLYLQLLWAVPGIAAAAPGENCCESAKVAVNSEQEPACKPRFLVSPGPAASSWPLQLAGGLGGRPPRAVAGGGWAAGRRFGLATGQPAARQPAGQDAWPNSGRVAGGRASRQASGGQRPAAAGRPGCLASVAAAQ